MADYAISGAIRDIAGAINNHAKSMAQIADAISRHADATLAASPNSPSSGRYTASSANSALNQRKVF